MGFADVVFYCNMTLFSSLLEVEMKFNNSIIGPLVDPQMHILRNHPASNREVGLNDAKFEHMCLQIGVSEYALNTDRALKTGHSIEHTQVPELDFSELFNEATPSKPSNDGNSPSQPTQDLSFDIGGFDL